MKTIGILLFVLCIICYSDTVSDPQLRLSRILFLFPHIDGTSSAVLRAKKLLEKSCQLTKFENNQEIPIRRNV
jgi:hypothetical protein